MTTTLTGSNAFALKAELDRLVTDFVKVHTDMGLERIDGEEATYERIRESLESLPFLASQKMVLLRTPSANKQFVENAENLLTELPESTDIIIVEPKLDKRSSYYKFLKKATDFKDFNEPDQPQLVNWLVAAAKERGGSLKAADATFLIERVGNNQQLLDNELHKLIDYQPEVTRQTIELLTDKTPQSTIFELMDAALRGQTKQALALYHDQRRQKVEPQQIIAMLAWQLHVLAVIKTAGERSTDEIATEAKLNPYVVRKSQALSSRLTLARLKELIRELLEIDIKLKRTSIDADEALQNYLLTLGSDKF